MHIGLATAARFYVEIARILHESSLTMDYGVRFKQTKTTMWWLKMFPINVSFYAGREAERQKDSIETKRSGLFRCTKLIL